MSHCVYAYSWKLSVCIRSKSVALCRSLSQHTFAKTHPHTHTLSHAHGIQVDDVSKIARETQ